MAKKTSGEYEYHVVGIRMRVTGTGNLQLQLSDLDQIQVKPLVALPLNTLTRIEPTRLSNFQSQRIRYELFTTKIDERFNIQRIIMFAKPIAMEYPG